MKIAIATGGRFHVLDLARELHALGHDVTFYSYVPMRRAEKFGLPRRCQRNLLPYVFPLLAMHGYGPRRMRPVFQRWLVKTLDWLVARRLEPCDVFIGMSGMFIRACETARTRYRARVLIERGSTHIVRQKDILDNLAGGARVSPFDIRRELASYKLADLIIIPSLHVEDSFTQLGFKKENLFRNRYGVDVEMFSSTPAPSTTDPTALFVGNWSYQKGCELWDEVLARLPDLRLIHVGARGDAPMPTTSRFTHVDPVNQWDLRSYYAQAHLCVLASRQEGLSLVLAQALSCGLPLVCSDQTGGRDLLDLVKDENIVRVFPVDDVDALCRALRESISYAMTRKGMRAIPKEVRDQLTWRAYGERYSRRIEELMATGSSAPSRDPSEA